MRQGDFSSSDYGIWHPRFNSVSADTLKLNGHSHLKLSAENNAIPGTSW